MDMAKRPTTKLPWGVYRTPTHGGTLVRAFTTEEAARAEAERLHIVHAKSGCTCGVPVVRRTA